MTKENSCRQIRILTRILAFACIASILLSYKLWLTDRNFPVVPIVRFFAFHHPYDFILPSIAVILLLLSGIIRDPQKFIIAFTGVAILLALGDMNRWQPWFYQYLLMFFVLCFFNYRCDDSRQQQAIITTFKIMIAAIYFWSGLQKLNPHFLADTFPWLMDPITRHMPVHSIQKFIFFGYAFPLLETGTGICLMIPALRRPAVIACTVMHLFILFVLSPLGHNYNPVVWPWNIAMILFSFVLFFNDEPAISSPVRNAFSYHSLKIPILLFVMMPLFNFFNSWDSYLSHNLYSGNTSNGVINISENVKRKLPSYIQQYAFGDEHESQINIKYWCMKELGVPAYPEKRNFSAVTESLFTFTSDSSEVYLFYTPKLKLNQK
jgi:uncharacterized membrane protein YphA (DoxX/SURF4 family)